MSAYVYFTSFWESMNFQIVNIDKIGKKFGTRVLLKDFIVQKKIAHKLWKKNKRPLGLHRI